MFEKDHASQPIVHNSREKLRFQWPKIRITIQPCYDFCPHKHHDFDPALQPVVGCHSDCLTFARRVFPHIHFFSRNFIDAVQFAYEPYGTELDHQRIKNIREAISLRAKALWQLPVEMGEIISEHLVREYAIVFICERWNWRYEWTRTLQTSRPIYARNISIDGIRYYSRISSDKSVTKHGRGIKIWEGGSVKKFVVYVARDHFGVRQVMFESPKRAVVRDATPGVWWEYLCGLDYEADDLWHFEKYGSFENRISVQFDVGLCLKILHTLHG